MIRVCTFARKTMKLRMILLSAAFASGMQVAIPAAYAAEAKPPAAKPITVNGKAISQAKMEAVVRQRVAQGQKDDESLRRGILEILVNQELLSQEAERLGLLKSGDNQMQIEL